MVRRRDRPVSSSAADVIAVFHLPRCKREIVNHHHGRPSSSSVASGD
jgi:hypothetical protein